MGVNRGCAGMVEFPCDIERLDNGNTLICDAGDETGLGSEVLEVDPIGNIVWRYAEGLRFVHSAKRHPNGNTLMADTTNNRVLEVNGAGKLLFTTDGLADGTGILSDGSHLDYPNNAEYLEDGSFLITDRNNNRCLILGRDGQVRWQYGGGIHHPHNAHMLYSGNVIIADSDGNRIIEVNRAGEIVWSYDGGGERRLNWPRDADRLPNGNTLITNSRDSSILEIDPQGNVVLEITHDYFANLYDTDYTPQGTYLVSDQQRHQVIEYDRYGNVVWQFRNYRNINTVQPYLKNGSFRKRGEDGPADWVVFTRFGEGGGKLIWDEAATPCPAPGLSFDREGSVFLMQMVDVTPGLRYKMAGTIKAEELDDGFVFLQIAFLDQYGALIEDAGMAPKSEMLTEPCDYHEEMLEAPAPPAAAMAEVRACISGKGRFYVKRILFA